MPDDIQRSIAHVAEAIERLNQAFEQRADQLRLDGDSKELQDWMKATYAMRDSGNIYLTWAKHYARAAGVPSGSDSDLEEFLDEGAVQ